MLNHLTDELPEDLISGDHNMGPVPSPQPPPPICTSGDPTPTLGCVSSTPSLPPMTTFTSGHHQPMPNHTIHPYSYNAMGGGGGGNMAGGRPPRHMVAGSGPRMAAIAHLQKQQHGMRTAATHGMSGPMRVEMPGHSPHGMIVPPNQMSIGAGMGPHGPMIGHHQTVGPPHGMGQMQMAGGHQYMHQHHPHPVVAGGHHGMHSMMGGPGPGMPQQPPMGPGGMQSPGMVNMTQPPGGAPAHMSPHSPHAHMRTMTRSSPRPTITNSMVPGIFFANVYVLLTVGHFSSE